MVYYKNKRNIAVLNLYKVVMKPVAVPVNPRTSKETIAAYNHYNVYKNEYGIDFDDLHPIQIKWWLKKHFPVKHPDGSPLAYLFMDNSSQKFMRRKIFPLSYPNGKIRPLEYFGRLDTDDYDKDILRHGYTEFKTKDGKTSRDFQ